MRRQAGRLALSIAVASLPLLSIACATTKISPGPPRMAVHQDTLEPSLVQTFVDARLKWVAHLKSVGASDLRGAYLQIGDHTFWSLYRFATWKDLGRRAELIETRGKNIAKQQGDDYDRDSDRSLVFPHKSEIWIEEPDLEFGAPSPDALVDSAVAELVIENVQPTKDKQYWDTWPIVAKALAQVKYPLQRVTYHSFYGTGQIYSFWIAPSEAVLKSTPPLAQALAQALGAQRAGELLQQWRECVLATETKPVIVRHDMFSPP